MARSPRIFQIILTSTETQKPMKVSFSTEAKAHDDIATAVRFSRTERGQKVWGDITSAMILNKETGETVTVI